MEAKYRSGNQALPTLPSFIVFTKSIYCFFPLKTQSLRTLLEFCLFFLFSLILYFLNHFNFFLSLPSSSQPINFILCPLKISKQTNSWTSYLPYLLSNFFSYFQVKNSLYLVSAHFFSEEPEIKYFRLCSTHIAIPTIQALCCNTKATIDNV